MISLIVNKEIAEESEYDGGSSEEISESEDNIPGKITSY